jgi:hypothetical protein
LLLQLLLAAVSAFEGVFSLLQLLLVEFDVLVRLL